MKKKIFNNVGTVLKYNGKIVVTEENSRPITHISMTAHFPGLVQIL